MAGLIADLTAEEAVLGALVIGGSQYMPVLLDTGLTEQHFYKSVHGDAWGECVTAFDNGTPIDVITVPALAHHAGPVPDLGSSAEYARRIVEKALWRQRQRAGFILAQAAEDEDEGAVAEAERLLVSPRASKNAFTPVQLGSVMLDRLERTTSGGWEIPFLNARMYPGTVWLWGGWTSHGKTVWVDQIARSLRAQRAVVWAWLNEMTAEERIVRHVSSQTGLDLERVQDNDLTEVEKASIVPHLKSIPFGVTECPGWTAEAICRDIRVRRPDVAIIDILHRVPYENERDLARVSRLLGDTAKLANTAIMATVHLNRGRIQTPDRPQPTLSDIKGASAFEQDADVVGMVWRKDDPASGRPTDDGMIYFLKARQFKPHGTEVFFHGSRAEFEAITW